MVIADTNHLAHGSVIGSAPLQMALCAYQRVNVHYQSPRLVQSFTKRASLVKPKPWFGTTPPFTDVEGFHHEEQDTPLNEVQGSVAKDLVEVQ